MTKQRIGDLTKNFPFFFGTMLYLKVITPVKKMTNKDITKGRNMISGFLSYLPPDLTVTPATLYKYSFDEMIEELGPMVYQYE